MTFRLSWLHLAVFLAIVSYPVNWMLMRHGAGLFDNDPKSEWVNNIGETQYGPDLERRTAAFAFSPITAPVNLIAAICQTTMPAASQKVEQIELRK